MTIYLIAAIAIGGAAAFIIATIIAELIAKAGFPLPTAERRIGHIDGLRGYLALSVLVHHFIIWVQVTRLGSNWTPPALNLFEQLGAAAVALFFMTTGLVFYPRMLAGFRACVWPAIYTTRLFRIMPMILLSFVLITAIITLRTGAAFDDSFPKAAAEWISTWAEPPLLRYPDSGRLNAYVLWSLWYEWLFYIFMLPACALAFDLSRTRLPSWILPVALVFGALAARALHVSGSVFIYVPPFAIGMLAYECQQREGISRALRTPAATRAAGISLGLGMFAFAEPYTAALPLFGFFFICVACGNDMGGILRARGALVLGTCSYGIYLLHGIFLDLVFVDAAALIAPISTIWLPVLLPMLAAMIMIVTPLTHFWIEEPAIRVGSRLVRRYLKLRVRISSPELEIAP